MGKLENLTNMAELQKMLEAQESGPRAPFNIEEMKEHLTFSRERPRITSSTIFAV